MHLHANVLTTTLLFFLGFPIFPLIAQPVNDLCRDALAISCQQVVTGTTMGSTDDVTSNCGTAFDRNMGGIWYQLTGTGDIIQLSTCSSNTSFDTQISVFTGSCSNFNCVDGNNDDANCTFSNRQSSVAFASSSNVTYYILIHSFSGVGDFELTITCQVPTNDLCSGGTPISCGETLSGSTFGGTTDGVGNCGDASDELGAGVWYIFSGNGDDITASTCSPNADFDTQISVFTGSCGNLICLTGNDDSDNCTNNNSLSTVHVTTDNNTNYYILVHGFDEVGDFELSLNCTNNCMILPLRIELEGAFNPTTQLMRTQLQVADLLPNNQPFTTAPWAYEGTETVNIFPGPVVDWLLIELRNANNPQLTIAQKAALLLDNGSVVDVNWVTDNSITGVQFCTTTAGNYHIVVKSRNHLSVMSRSAIALSTQTPTYDFTTGLNQASGSEQMTILNNGEWALRAGDNNGNGIINVADFNIFQQALNNGGGSTYTINDINFDGTVSIDDFNVYLPNASKIGVMPIRL